MGKWVVWLSGGVPGGVLLLLFLLLIVNLLIYFLKSSKLLTREQGRKNRIFYSSVLLLLYVAAWLMLRPPLPRERIIVLPETPVSGTFVLNGPSIEFAELFERSAINHLQKKFLLHRWQWLYQTIGRDSIGIYGKWQELAQKIGPDWLIKTRATQSGFECKVFNQNDSIVIQASSRRALLNKIFQRGLFFKKGTAPVVHIPSGYLEKRLMALQGSYEELQNMLDADGAPWEQQLLAEVLCLRGLQVPIDHEKAQYVKVHNPYLDKAKRILFNLIKKKQDTAQTAYWLGRIAVYFQDYSQAEIFLKKALLEDPDDSRILYALHYLHPDRLTDFGYENRSAILQQAVDTDPGYREAVFALANEYYLSGSGSEKGLATTRANQTIENFLRLQSNDLKILGLKASLEMKMQHYEKAIRIYSMLAVRQPDNSNSYYNLGSVYFMKKEYKKALKLFLKAIDMDNNLDAYLYAGITYRYLGNNEKALEYYRERIRRRTGDNDTWAKEAMKGIRAILADTSGGHAR